MQFHIHLIIFLLNLIVINYCDCEPVTLYVPFNSGGLRGNITFHQERPAGSVLITIHLISLPTAIGQQYEWSINAFPVFYDLKSSCSTNELGKLEHDMFRRHGPIQIPPIDNKVQTFIDDQITLRGSKSIWGKSVLLKNTNSSDQMRSCSNVLAPGQVKTAIATFNDQIAGTILLRENERQETMIFTNLFNTAEEYKPASKHDWKILVTDILDTKRERKCEYLQNVLDPNDVDDSSCSSSDHSKCKMGDLIRKHGQIIVGSNNNRYSKQFVIDTHLSLSILESSREIYVVLYEKNRVFTCSKINPVTPKEVKANFNMDGVKGSILFSQGYRTDPTVVTVNLENLRGRGKWYHVHEFPVPQRQTKDDELCSPQSVGGHFNPFGVDPKIGPPAGIGTNDQYEIGDLSGKYGPLTEDQDLYNFLGIYVDMNLPLFGINSIVGRSVVIHKADGKRWICANIGYPGKVITAAATFVFPIVGQVIFRQGENSNLDETTVFVELSYSDGTTNNTENHAWHVHENEHGRDFYNWSKRCSSAGSHYNPSRVGLGRLYSTQCSSENPLRCELGDLTSKSKRISIAAYKNSVQNKLFYTDIQLPLSGSHSIVGRSIVVHDDSAPKQRGNRLACSIIRYVHSITAAVRSWKSGSGITSNVSGSMVFFQESESDETDIKIDLHGLNKLASGYHVHKVWVPKDKEFPCSSDSVYSHFNPFGIDIRVGPSPKVGSTDQYEVGDISGKFGLLDGKLEHRVGYRDKNLPLIGQNSIIGRSVVIHKKEKSFRWVCGTIMAEAHRDKAREIVALVSLDDPRYRLTGYIRMRQFEYTDGSLSNTWIEVDLKYPGQNNKNITYGHEWAVFVNQAGEDAFNNIDSVRCIAAGYRWNPYLSKDDIQLYKMHCSSSNPLRCAMGDLSGKHGLLTIGSERRVFTDINLPLIGNYSVMGRSIVIFSKNESNIPLACGNIKPDIHLVGNVAIKKNPAFTVGKFMQHMTSLLNTTSWLVVPDAHATKDILNNECVQLTVNFYGSEAHKLQIEFSNLINLGTVKRNTRYGVESVSTYYKPCKTLSEISGSTRPHITILLTLFSVLTIWSL